MKSHKRIILFVSLILVIGTAVVGIVSLRQKQSSAEGNLSPTAPPPITSGANDPIDQMHEEYPRDSQQ